MRAIILFIGVIVFSCNSGKVDQNFQINNPKPVIPVEGKIEKTLDGLTLAQFKGMNFYTPESDDPYVVLMSEAVKDLYRNKIATRFFKVNTKNSYYISYEKYPNRPSVSVCIWEKVDDKHFNIYYANKISVEIEIGNNSLSFKKIGNISPKKSIIFNNQDQKVLDISGTWKGIDEGKEITLEISPIEIAPNSIILVHCKKNPQEPFDGSIPVSLDESKSFLFFDDKATSKKYFVKSVEKESLLDDTSFTKLNLYCEIDGFPYRFGVTRFLPSEKIYDQQIDEKFISEFWF